MSGIPKDILAKKRASWAELRDEEVSTACASTMASSLAEFKVKSTDECSYAPTLASLAESEVGNPSVADKSDTEVVSDLETETTSASRTSKSRPSYLRSENRKARRREAHIARAVAKNAANGIAFNPVSHADHRAAQRANMLVHVGENAPGIAKGSVLEQLTPESIINHWMAVAENKRRTSAEGIEYFFTVEEYFTPKYSPKPQHQASRDLVHKRYVIPKQSDGSTYWWCVLCGKYYNESHGVSSMHSQRVEETAAVDEMIGLCTTTRRFSPSPGLASGLNARDFKLFWGERVHEMPAILRNRLLQGAKIQIKLPGFGKQGRILGHSDILSIGMACVSYPGQGQYNVQSACSERAIRWEELCEDKIPDTYGHFDRLIDDDHQKQPEPTDGVKNCSLRDQIPAGSGWWPACIINWHSQHTDSGYTTREGYFTAVIGGVCVVYVVCWYQLLDGGHIITAWPIRLTSRL